jgi:hypothetical protein
VEDVGKPRDQVTAPRVAELNAYTPVRLHESARYETSDPVAPGCGQYGTNQRLA